MLFDPWPISLLDQASLILPTFAGGGDCDGRGLRALADRGNRRDRELVLASFVQILGLVAGLIGWQSPSMPLALRSESSNVHVVGGDIAVTLQGWLPRDDDGRGRAGDGLHAGRHFRQIFFSDAIER